jgi:hypothetical protein
MTALKYWNQSANNGNGAWATMIVGSPGPAGAAGVYFGTAEPEKTQLWADQTSSLKYWDQTANGGAGAWTSFVLQQVNNLSVSTDPPQDVSKLWVNPNDIEYINAIDGGSA